MQPELNVPKPSLQPVAQQADQKPYTILRIKRKRHEEPLDALVIESSPRKKRTKSGLGMFQYAETVEKDAWNDARMQKDIQDKISRLSREVTVKEDSRTSVPVVPPKPAQQAAIDLPTRGDNTLDASPIESKQEDAVVKRYTIVDHSQQQQQQLPTRRYPTEPPKVLSAKELAASKSAPDFKMYDAIPEGHGQALPSAIDNVPSEMDKFLPMLQDYLKIHDTDFSKIDAPLKKSSASKKNTEHNVIANPDLSDDDYVWDVFYHRPVSLSGWNGVANVATVTGLPPSLINEYDSASDSDEEYDEADEDSNAEEYYKNDYPDEDSDSDEFHEDSDYEDVTRYRAAGGDDSDF